VADQAADWGDELVVREPPSAAVRVSREAGKKSAKTPSVTATVVHPEAVVAAGVA